MSRRFSVSEILVLGLWIGLLGGFAQVAMLGIARFGLHRAIHAGVHDVWAIPVSLAVLGGLAALPAALLASTRAGARWPTLPLGILCFLAIANVTLPFFQISREARLLLTAGLAIQAARVLARDPARLVRVSRRSVLPLIALVGFFALGVPLTLRAWERAQTAALPAPSPGAPNVLFVVLDTERALDLSLYGYERRTTPVLERLATEGVVFERAYATSSWTLSSHASLFTGRLPLDLGAGWLTPLNGGNLTLAEAFAGRGYLTGGFSANSFYVSRATGLAQGFAHFEGHPITPLSVLFRSAVGARLATPEIRGRLFNSYQFPGRKSARQLTRDVVTWIGQSPVTQPYFVFVNYFDAHQPYLPPAPFDTAFTGRVAPWSIRNPLLDFGRTVTPSAVRPERDAYDQAIASQDGELGAMLTALERSGRLRNTIVVITSDHGEEFAEHGLLDHGNSLNPALLWVPLVVLDPARRLRGVRVREPVSLLDLPATVLSLADSSRPSELPGFSLLPHLHPGPGALRSPVVSELPRGIGKHAWLPVSKGPLQSLTVGYWHYIRDAEGGETLMDLLGTPEGRMVRPSSPEEHLLLARMRSLLDSAIARHRGRT